MKVAQIPEAGADFEKNIIPQFIADLTRRRKS